MFLYCIKYFLHKNILFLIRNIYIHSRILCKIIKKSNKSFQVQNTPKITCQHEIKTKYRRKPIAEMPCIVLHTHWYEIKGETEFNKLPLNTYQGCCCYCYCCWQIKCIPVGTTYMTLGLSYFWESFFSATPTYGIYTVVSCLCVKVCWCRRKCFDVLASEIKTLRL